MKDFGKFSQQERLESRYLPALLAHELGHLQSMDARLMAAVERLEVAGVRPLLSAPAAQQAQPAGSGGPG